MKTRYLCLVVIIILSCLFPKELEAQCAMCRAVLESGESQEAAEGINNGIVYLMAIPYLVVGVIGYFVYKTMKPAK